MNLKTLHQLTTVKNKILSPDFPRKYANFAFFLMEFGNMDKDLNKVLQWSVMEMQDGTYNLYIWMAQYRTLIIDPCSITDFKQDELPALLEFLLKHQDSMNKTFEPLKYWCGAFLTWEQAVDFLRVGKKIRHLSFEPYEYLTLSNPSCKNSLEASFIYNNGRRFQINLDFFIESKFANGWSIVEPVNNQKD